MSHSPEGLFSQWRSVWASWGTWRWSWW